jgi:hypothetical protein
VIKVAVADGRGSSDDLDDRAEAADPRTSMIAVPAKVPTMATQVTPTLRRFPNIALLTPFMIENTDGVIGLNNPTRLWPETVPKTRADGVAGRAGPMMPLPRFEGIEIMLTGSALHFSKCFDGPAQYRSSQNTPFAFLKRN